jgi:hypothetical protein
MKHPLSYRTCDPHPLALAAFMALAVVVCLPANAPAQRANSPFPGGENADGSLRPTARLTRLFTQDAYTGYTLLEPGSDRFRIRYFTETSRAGATELVNATRGGSEGGDIEVYDPRTGNPLPFTYEEEGDGHAIHARLTTPVPEGGTGRVLIYKTYEDSRTYQLHREANPRYDIRAGDITWVRSLAGYRLGVVLPKGYALLSSNVAAHVSTTSSGQVALHFANPSGLSNPLTVHARPTTVAFTPAPYTDVFFDDVKTLYDLDAPASHRIRVDQVYSEYRRGGTPTLPLLAHAALDDLRVIDLDTARPLPTSGSGAAATVGLEVPIVNERQSAHLEVTGTLVDDGYRVEDGVLVFDRELRGLRNTVLLPAGWEVSAVSQAATIGVHDGRAFVALINLNAENAYRVVVRAVRGERSNGGVR